VYRENKVEQNPLDKAKKFNKRALEEPSIAEDRATRQRLENDITDQFGNHVQPAIEKVNFTVSGKFGSGEYEVEKEFSCKVTFEGPNVLEGLRSLVSHGIAKLPYPPFLADLHSSARNKFVLEDDTDQDHKVVKS